jgi:hypothetical protein
MRTDMAFIAHSFRVLISIISVAAIWFCITSLVSIILIKILWDSTIPLLFPGWVEQGFLAGSLSLWTAAKLSLLVALLKGGFLKGTSKNPACVAAR